MNMSWASQWSRRQLHWVLKVDWDLSRQRGLVSQEIAARWLGSWEMEGKNFLTKSTHWGNHQEL